MLEEVNLLGYSEGKVRTFKMEKNPEIQHRNKKMTDLCTQGPKKRSYL